MVEQANELILDILPLSADTARLVRVYGTAPCVALPGSVPAPEGGSLALTELGDYCFSEKPRSLPAPDALCRYAVSADGTVRLTRAFGQAVGQKPARRYLTTIWTVILSTLHFVVTALLSLPSRRPERGRI